LAGFPAECVPPTEDLVSELPSQPDADINRMDIPAITTEENRWVVEKRICCFFCHLCSKHQR
jgi:hypothetical protein